MKSNAPQVRTQPDVGIWPRRIRRAARNLTLLVLFALTAGGCATAPLPLTGTAVVPNSLRSEIGRLAIRSPSTPSVSLTADLDNKGEAAANIATSAGAGWLGGTAQAAGETGEPITASVILVLGLVTTPIVAAGGAVYGASAANTDEEIARGNADIERALDFAPEYFERSVETAFADAVPIPYEFVGALTNEELLRRGFDSVLDLRMVSITSAPGESRLNAGFATSNEVRLTRLANSELLVYRTYSAALRPRTVSSWAGDNGDLLLRDLDDAFSDIAEDMVDQFFVATPIRVRGLEPVSRGWLGTATISGTVPMFVWAGLDGQKPPGADVTYEVVVYPKGQAPERGVLTSATRHVPSEPLLACQQYRWKVRAHYDSFGDPAETEWTPEYRFRTPCDKR